MSLTRKTPLARSGPIKPKRRSASEYARIYGSKERVAWVKALPCLVCGTVPSDNAHTRINGMGIKASYTVIVPLCRTHHRELHDAGIRSFAAKYDVDLELAAVATEQQWLAHLARTR